MTDFATMALIEDHLRRVADSLAAIAAALTAPTARPVDLTPPDPNRCDPGCVRPSLHGGDCSPAEANEYAPGGWASEPHHEWRPGRHIAEGMTVRIIGADGSTRVGTVGEATEADGLTSWALIPAGLLQPSPIPDYAARVMADCNAGLLPAILEAADKGCDDIAAAVRLTSSPGDLPHAIRSAVERIRAVIHADDMPDRHRDRTEVDWSRRAVSLETGEPMPVHVVVTNRQTGATLFDGDLAKLPADLDPSQGGWSADDLVQPMADPLDESDHRPRHCGGDHLYRWGHEHWHTKDPATWPSWCICDRSGDYDSLNDWIAEFGPLALCDCEADHGE